MRIAIAGGGIVGTFTALCLARRGHDVTVVDRDPGPAPDGSWRRVGVMQFDHPHGWRPQVLWALREEVPDVYADLVREGVQICQVPGAPERMARMWARRCVVERALRKAAHQQPGLRWIVGHVDDIVMERGAARGLLVDAAPLAADLVIVATGRASRLADDLRGPLEGGSCGFAYVSRMYRARPGRPACDLDAPRLPFGPGYHALVMPQDAGTHSLLICYPRRATELDVLRTNAGFDRAVAAIPDLAPWCDADRFEPLTDTLVGGNLTNTYRLQGPALGMPPARDLLFVGDAVSTMNPIAGRYVALALQHIQHLLSVLDDPATDSLDASLALDVWAEQHIRPWYLEHVRWDRSMLQRFGGGDVDLTAPLPPDVVLAAVEREPAIAPFAAQWFAMTAGPEVLDLAREPVLALLASGWRPTPAGPNLTTLPVDLDHSKVAL